jgi:predicted RNA-binding Zn-ribbon protein involved in translation (DUF1610 family)
MGRGLNAHGTVMPAIGKKKGGRAMKRLANMMLALALMVSFAGCASMNSGMVSKDAKVKCPKCGAIYTVEEGRRALEAGP